MTRLDYEKSRRSRRPLEFPTDSLPSISEELASAMRSAIPSTYMRKPDASLAIQRLRKELFEAVVTVRSEEFCRLCPPDADTVHIARLMRASAPLLKLDRLPLKLLYGFSNDRISETDPLISFARQLASRFARRIQDVKKLSDYSSCRRPRAARISH